MQEVTAFEHRLGHEYQPENPVELIAWLQDAIAKVPAEYADSARVEIECDTAWDTPIATLRVIYRMPSRYAPPPSSE